MYLSFRPSFAVTVATAAAVALTLALGHWQERRAAEKLARAAQFGRRMAAPRLALPASPVDAASLQYRRVAARGEYVPARSFFLDNKVLNGVPGYFVITPLRLEGGNEYVLVNRGWVAAGPRRDQLPVVATPTGSQLVEGIATVPTKRFLQLGADAPGRVRENLVLKKLAHEWRIPLQSIVLQQTGGPADGLVRRWAPPDTGAERSRSYALQWYSFAALAVFLYVALNVKRVRRVR